MIHEKMLAYELGKSEFNAHYLAPNFIFPDRFINNID